MEGDQRTYTSNAKFCISIHTLRVEGDKMTTQKDAGQRDFNPHPPRGG